MLSGGMLQKKGPGLVSRGLQQSQMGSKAMNVGLPVEPTFLPDATCKIVIEESGIIVSAIEGYRNGA